MDRRRSARSAAAERSVANRPEGGFEPASSSCQGERSRGTRRRMARSKRRMARVASAESEAPSSAAGARTSSSSERKKDDASSSSSESKAGEERRARAASPSPPMATLAAVDGGDTSLATLSSSPDRSTRASAFAFAFASAFGSGDPSGDSRPPSCRAPSGPAEEGSLTMSQEEAGEDGASSARGWDGVAGGRVDGEGGSRVARASNTARGPFRLGPSDVDADGASSSLASSRKYAYPAAATAAPLVAAARATSCDAIVVARRCARRARPGGSQPAPGGGPLGRAETTARSVSDRRARNARVVMTFFQSNCLLIRLFSKSVTHLCSPRNPLFP